MLVLKGRSCRCSCPQNGQRNITFTITEWLCDLASALRPERAVFRLRKWIILRLVSIVDSLHLEKEEALIEEVARCEACSNHNPHGWSSQRVGPLA